MRKPPKYPFGYSSWIEMFDSFCKDNIEIYDNHKDLMKVKLQITYQTALDAPTKVFKITMKQLMVYCWMEMMDKRMTPDETFVCVNELARGIDYDNELRDKAIDLLHTIQWEIDG